MNYIFMKRQSPILYTVYPHHTIESSPADPLLSCSDPVHTHYKLNAQMTIKKSPVTKLKKLVTMLLIVLAPGGQVPHEEGINEV